METARAQAFPEERIWDELAEPAVEALLSAGLKLEAEKILGSMADVPALLERHLGELRAARGMEGPEALSLAARLARILTEASLRLLRKCLMGLRQVLGEEHPDTIAAADALKRFESRKLTA